MTTSEPAALPLRFDDSGLIPAVIVDADDGNVLMVGFMNAEALDRTRETGLVHFWSRSRQALWKKGESSGHLQRVREIRVNCDRNSLLIEVEQVGAVCHDGYDTCYYRRLEPDNTLSIVRDRQFDPRDIYPGASEPHGLATRTREWWRAYEWLRDTDLSAESGTSQRLRSDSDTITPRLIDELRELAGVLDGTHRHGELDADLRLEAGQVLYWVACAGVRNGRTWDDVRPDRALDIVAGDAPTDGTLAALLSGRAAVLESADAEPDADLLHDTLAQVRTVLAAHDIDPLDLIESDLAELRGKPYWPES